MPTGEKLKEFKLLADYVNNNQKYIDQFEENLDSEYKKRHPSAAEASFKLGE